MIERGAEVAEPDHLGWRRIAARDGHVIEVSPGVWAEVQAPPVVKESLIPAQSSEGGGA